MSNAQKGRVSDSVTGRIGVANVGLRYLATLNKLTRRRYPGGQALPDCQAKPDLRIGLQDLPNKPKAESVNT